VRKNRGLLPSLQEDCLAYAVRATRRPVRCSCGAACFSYPLLDNEINRQAATIAYINDFKFMMIW
jgi:hypothetical protein